MGTSASHGNPDFSPDSQLKHMTQTLGSENQAKVKRRPSLLGGIKRTFSLQTGANKSTSIGAICHKVTDLINNITNVETLKNLHQSISTRSSSLEIQNRSYMLKNRSILGISRLHLDRREQLDRAQAQLCTVANQINLKIATLLISNAGRKKNRV